MAPSERLEQCDKGSVFLALRWHELFDRYTPDSFHPKLLTIPGLVEEAVQTAELGKQVDLWGKHLVMVQEELSERLQVGQEKNLLTAKQKNLLHSIATSQKADEVYGLGRLLLLEDVAGGLEAAIRAALGDLAGTGAEGAKADTDALLGLVGSQAFRRGGCAEDYEDVDDAIALAPGEVVEWITSRIPKAEADFDCIVAVELPDNADGSELRSILGYRGIKATSPRVPGLPVGKNLLFPRKTVSSLRDSEAFRLLRDEVQDALSLFGFYRQASAPTVWDMGWIYDVASGHPLLLHRVYEAWKFVNDPRAMFQRQQRSRKALRWHLWRIYRARNLLVHQGVESRFVPQLANHLQHYLSLTLSRILHGITFGPEWTIKDSLLYWQAKAAYVDSCLDKDPKSLVIGDLFPEQVGDPDHPVWS